MSGSFTKRGNGKNCSEYFLRAYAFLRVLVLFQQNVRIHKHNGRQLIIPFGWRAALFPKEVTRNEAVAATWFLFAYIRAPGVRNASHGPQAAVKGDAKRAFEISVLPTLQNRAEIHSDVGRGDLTLRQQGIHFLDIENPSAYSERVRINPY